MRNYSIRPRDDGRAARRVLAMPLSRRQRWFDDEVAIDFPSLHAAVERMREAFRRRRRTTTSSGAGCRPSCICRRARRSTA